MNKYATGVRGPAWSLRATACVCAGLTLGLPAMADDTGGHGAPPVSAGGTASSAAPAHVAAPVPTHGPDCVGLASMESAVSLAVGKSMLVNLHEPIKNRTVGNPAIVQAALVSPSTLYLVGQSVGSTNMILQARTGSCRILDVVVNVDSGGIQASLAQLLPEEHRIHVGSAGDHIVLSGAVSNAEAAQRAAEIAGIYASANGKSGGLLNMLSIDAPQQVMLEVKVAEVDKTLLDQLGASVNLGGGFGTWSGGLVSSLLTGAANVLSINKANNRPFSVNIDAQKGDNLVKILAEPNLATISGHEATFLAGGEVFIPVPQGGSNNNTITLQQENYGVSLKFTPTVLANGRINLEVAPEVSELSSTGVTVTANGSTTSSSTAVLPLITTRRASTMVQIGDGQSLAIGGLISNDITGALSALPGVGELPVLGALFRSTSFQQNRTELVFVVTPHLVKPQTEQSYPLPTDSFTQPNEADVYATGNMEGRKYPAQPAAPAPQPASAPAALPAPAAGATPPATAPAATPAPAAAVTAPAPVTASQESVAAPAAVPATAPVPEVAVATPAATAAPAVAAAMPAAMPATAPAPVAATTALAVRPIPAIPATSAAKAVSGTGMSTVAVSKKAAPALASNTETQVAKVARIEAEAARIAKAQASTTKTQASQDKVQAPLTKAYMASSAFDGDPILGPQPINLGSASKKNVAELKLNRGYVFEFADVDR